MKAANWIDQVRAARHWRSDYKAAQELRVHKNTIYGYRASEDATLADDVAVKVAEAMGCPPAVVLLDQLAERATGQVREVLLQLLQHASECDCGA